MRFSKKISILAVSFFVFFSVIFMSACNISTNNYMKDFEGTYIYESAINTLNEKSAVDFKQGGDFTLTIRDGKAVFNNLSAPNSKGFVFTLDASTYSNTLKLYGMGYYYKQTDNGGAITTSVETADYVFGSAIIKDGKLVVKLMFVKYATVSENTSLESAVEITFSK